MNLAEDEPKVCEAEKALLSREDEQEDEEAKAVGADGDV